MIVAFVTLVLSSLLAITVTHVLYVLLRQYQINQYFKSKSPKLPVADELTSIFGGHARTLVHQRNNVFMIDGLHKKYGKTFGFYYADLPSVATTDLELIKTMVLDEPYDHVNKIHSNLPIEELEDDCILVADDKQWERLRNATAPALTNHKIKAPNVMGELSEIVNKFIISLQARIDKAVANKGENYIIEDVDELFHRYALALVFKCFYKQDKIIDFDAREDYWVNLIGNTLRHGIRLVFVLCTIFRPLKPFVSKCSLYLTEEGVLRLKVMSFIRQQTGLNLRAREELNEAKRLAEKEGRHFDIDNYRLRDGSKFSRNLIDHFIDKYHEGRLTEREYLRTSFFLFFAANKTSSDSISILIYHLASHPQVQEKLRKAIEIEGIECKYLLWCINESMRLIPPAPIGCSRIISRDYTTKEGYLIPANTWVYTSAYSIHREPEYWGSDANEFKPERWARARDFHPVQYLAFGAGKRNCIGKYFALHEMKLLMGALMGKFRFEECSKTINVDKFQCPMLLFTVFDKPLYVKISNLGS